MPMCSLNYSIGVTYYIDLKKYLFIYFKDYIIFNYIIIGLKLNNKVVKWLG
jgi:hypothetical protein